MKVYLIIYMFTLVHNGGGPSLEVIEMSSLEACQELGTHIKDTYKDTTARKKRARYSNWYPTMLQVECTVIGEASREKPFLERLQ